MYTPGYLELWDLERCIVEKV